jgi:cysteine desulfurase
LRSVYLDYSATTPTRPEVVEAMLPYFSEHFGNPSSVHQFSRRPKAGLDEARGHLAAVLGCRPEEIVLTSGGTESDNLAIKGVVLSSPGPKRHVITSQIEHKAVLETCRYLEKSGVEVSYLPVDGDGLVSPDDLKQALRPETVVVSIMHANNETGTVQPIHALSTVAREARIPFHTDAVQSFAKIPTRVDELGVQLLSLSSHKIYGPKGVGALYVAKGTKLSPLFHGGHHERGKRAGTENVPGIVGLGEAARLAEADRDEEGKRLDALRQMLWEGISSRIGKVSLNGHPTARLPHVASISVAGVEGEGMLLGLEMLGVAISTGSACTSDTLEASHVLTAMGLEHALAQGTLRFSLGRGTTGEEIATVIDLLPGIVERLRRMSPIA